jgi:hypothetical protein
MSKIEDATLQTKNAITANHGRIQELRTEIRVLQAVNSTLSDRVDLLRSLNID